MKDESQEIIIDENKSRSLELATKRYFGEFLSDDNINEICYNGDGSIWTLDINSHWTEHKKNHSYSDMITFATPLASFKDDVLKANKPILSATLNSGERVQVVIPPASKKGMLSVTIRKPSKVRFTNEDYKRQGYYDNVKHDYEVNLTPDELDLINFYKAKDYVNFIPLAIKLNKNIVIAGATGTGKTTYMKSLIDFIPLDERLITIEDTEEISFYEHKNYVQLFYPSEAKYGDPLTSATLLKSCLRMKPDRILLAELRGGEAYDYLDILGSGHGGSMTSIHAGSVETAMSRLSRMARKNPFASNESADDIKNEFKDVIDVIINIKEHKGKRWINDIYLKGYYKGLDDG